MLPNANIIESCFEAVQWTFQKIVRFFQNLSNITLTSGLVVNLSIVERTYIKTYIEPISKRETEMLQFFQPFGLKFGIIKIITLKTFCLLWNNLNSLCKAVEIRVFTLR